MPSPQRFGIPAIREPLAPTSFAAPSRDARVTVIPVVPLVPARALLASALAADTGDRDVAWVEFPPGPVDEATALASIDAALGGRSRRTLLVITLDADVDQDVDGALLDLLRERPELSIAALCSGRRHFESLARGEHDATVVSPLTMISDAAQVGEYSRRFGLQLTADQAVAIAATPLALPDLLPAVLGSMTLEALETPDDAVLDLVDELERYLPLRLRTVPETELLAALPLALPSVVTARVVAVVDPLAGNDVQLERAMRAGMLRREPGAGAPRYRLEPVIRAALLDELRRRDPALVRSNDVRLAVHFREGGDPAAAITHFCAAELWDDAVDVIDSALFRLVAGHAQQLRDAVLAFPRKVRDENPRLALVLELGWEPGESAAQGHLVVSRRAGGTAAALPDVMSPWDRLHAHLAKTIVLRLRGDHTAALREADALDALLDTDDIAARPLGTLAEANYQSGMTRLLGLDLVGARESFSRSYALDESGRGAEAVALVRALEGEAVQASGMLGLLDGTSIGTAGLIAHALVGIGRLDPRDARHWLARLASSHHDDEFWPFAVHAADRFGLYWGDPVETDSDLDRAWAEHNDQLVPGSTAQLLLTSDAADLALMLGQLSRAEAALDHCPVRNTWIAVPRARLALLSGSPKHALLFILEAQARGRTERYGQLDLAVLRAAAELALGRDEDATASLLRAVNQSDKSGVIVPFNLLPHETLASLAALHPDVRAFVEGHDLTGTSYLAPYQSAAGALSERELVVLRALDPAATVEQIAKRLFVASNTVKAQLRSIYRKLGVSTRTEALLVAAELGLLDKDSRTA